MPLHDLSTDPPQKQPTTPELGAAGQLLEPTVQVREVIDELFSLAYEELRRVASAVKRGDASNTLSPTALVNEAWLKMAKSPPLGINSPLHFKCIAVRAMRQLLVEAARRRNAQKRGSGEPIFVTFDDSLFASPNGEPDLLALDAALSELACMAPRQAAIVESRFFGGFDVHEIAALMDMPEGAVMREWRAAKAWLEQRLER